MGSRGCVALRLGVLLWRRAFSPGAWPAAAAGLRLRMLSVGRLPVGQTLGEVCPAPDRARGLHGGPGLEERAEGTAGEGRPESGTGGTGEEEGAGSQLKRMSSSLFAFLMGSQNSYRAELEGTAKVVGTNFAFHSEIKRRTEVSQTPGVCPNGHVGPLASPPHRPHPPSHFV